MKFDQAMLQVSHYKDLVTLVNPRSFFTYINYLHEKGRLYHYLNASFDTVLRSEFENYLQWAVQNNPLVELGNTVQEVEFDNDFIVKSDNGEYRTSNICIGVGRAPNIPVALQHLMSANFIHSSEYKTRQIDLKNKRLCVVGGGQSGAEIILDVLNMPTSEIPSSIHWFSRRENYFPIDDTPFTNEFFTPSYSDWFSKLEGDKQEKYLKENILASDGISLSTLEQIYQNLYRLNFIEKCECNIFLKPGIHVEKGTNNNSVYSLTTRSKSNGHMDETLVDVVVLATGYKNAATTFMDPISENIEMRGNEIVINDDFSANWDGPKNKRIYIQNACSSQRGLAEPNLSLIAWRSNRILNSLFGYTIDRKFSLPTFVEWDQNVLNQTYDNEIKRDLLTSLEVEN